MRTCVVDRLAASVVVVDEVAALGHEVCEREAASESCNNPKNRDGSSARRMERGQEVYKGDVHEDTGSSKRERGEVTDHTHPGAAAKP